MHILYYVYYSKNCVLTKSLSHDYYYPDFIDKDTEAQKDKFNGPKIMVSCPITSRQIDGETVKTVTDIFWGGAPKSLQMVIAAMKLKDAYSL